mmetsp:Transcript_7567/g.4475  ORF Transcript_7567/g.4475 Transcript_7567/m.4475 type:complete len:91 (+) Transcript_7567:99-371(+)
MIVQVSFARHEKRKCGEQFRTVSTSSQSTFEYPSIPLPYEQRKSLSDNLFELSKEVPSLTDDCAGILRKAREEKMWGAVSYCIHFIPIYL